MSRTLKEQMEADLDDVFLAEEEFAETVFYAPAGGGPIRSFLAVWDPAATMADEPQGISDLSRGWLWCQRSPAAGIDDPQLGDRIWLESEGQTLSLLDPARAWTYAGESDDDDATSWALLFQRRRVERMGGNHV